MDQRIVLLTGSRVIPESAKAIIQHCVRRYHEEGAVLMIGDAPGFDTYAIQCADELNHGPWVYGAYGVIRNRTRTGQNIATQFPYLGRDNYMAGICELCEGFWNGTWNHNTRGHSGTIKTCKFVACNPDKPVYLNFLRTGERKLMTWLELEHL